MKSHKEPKFHTEEEFIDHILTYKPIRNAKNFKWFSLSTIKSKKKIDINRWLLVQDVETGVLSIKYYSYLPTSNVIAYANVIRKEI